MLNISWDACRLLHNKKAREKNKNKNKNKNKYIALRNIYAIVRNDFFGQILLFFHQFWRNVFY